MMKKANLSLHMVVITLCIVLAACSSDDSVSEQRHVLEAGKTYSLTVNASKSGGETRALNLNNEETPHTLTAIWETTEKVYFCKRKGNGDNDENTVISFTSTSFLQPQIGGSLETRLNGSITPSHELYFPIALTLLFPREEWNYTGQAGTIADIAAKYDYNTAPINLSGVTESGIEASTSVDFTCQQAIVKFTLKDKDNSNEATNAINATSLRISASGLAQSVGVSNSDDVYTFTDTPGDITITPSSGTSNIWVALRGISGKQVRLTATDGTNTYIYAKDNVTFTHGNYYEITVKMKKITEGIELSDVTTDYIGCVVGQDGKVYSTPAKATAASTTPVAMVAYVSSTGQGLAIALADESGTMTQNTAKVAASGKTTVPGGTWRLPTTQDWQYMLIGCGNGASTSDWGEVDATALTSKLATLDASLQTTGTYWSSSVDFFVPDFVGTTVNLSYTDSYLGGSALYYVRACLAF